MGKILKLEDLRPDPQNANKGTPRGHGIIERSIRQHGAGRSGLAAKDGTMIAGSQTLEEMAALGIPVKPVYTKGDEWVVVVREDIEPGSEEARLMALEDNRASETGLAWDASVLVEMSEDGIDLSGLWGDQEWADMLSQAGTDLINFAPGSIDEQGRLDEKAKCTCPNCGHEFTP